jgi:hypothetical protein
VSEPYFRSTSLQLSHNPGRWLKNRYLPVGRERTFACSLAAALPPAMLTDCLSAVSALGQCLPAVTRKIPLPSALLAFVARGVCSQDRCLVPCVPLLPPCSWTASAILAFALHRLMLTWTAASAFQRTDSSAPLLTGLLYLRSLHLWTASIAVSTVALLLAVLHYGLLASALASCSSSYACRVCRCPTFLSALHHCITGLLYRALAVSFCLPYHMLLAGSFAVAVS